jgi:peptidoglycan/xylan/chitin deacetylase (PgdA/CDA1 family)
VSFTRRTLLALSAGTLLSGCAIEPPPTIAQVRASASAASASSTPTFSTTLVSSASAPAGEPTNAAPSPGETPAETGSAQQATTSPEPAEANPAAATSTEQAPATGANHIAAAAPYAVPAATVHQWLVTRTGPPTPTVFLTYDDGPSPNLTPQLLDALKQLGVHATFFVVGYRLAQNPGVAQRAMAEGHAICLHSYSHDYRYLFPGRIGNADNVGADYDQALAVAKRVLGPSFASPGYRYPGGHMSWKGLEGSDAALAARGASWIDWNCMTGDAERHPTQNGDQGVQMASETLAKSGNPSAAVVLSHDSSGGYVSLESLPKIVQLFRDRGYGFGVIG